MGSWLRQWTRDQGWMNTHNRHTHTQQYTHIHITYSHIIPRSIWSIWTNIETVGTLWCVFVCVFTVAGWVGCLYRVEASSLSQCSECPHLQMMNWFLARTLSLPLLRSERAVRRKMDFGRRSGPLVSLVNPVCPVCPAWRTCVSPPGRGTVANASVFFVWPVLWGTSVRLGGGLLVHTRGVSELRNNYSKMK